MDTVTIRMEGEVLNRLLWRLKALREARGWTQEKFAEEANMSYKYYQAVEAGRKRDLRLSTLERLAAGHGMETWQLLSPKSHGLNGTDDRGRSRGV